MQGRLDIARRLADLAWPIIGLNVLQVLALAVDTAMVGRTPEHEAALTGMGYSSQLVFLLMVAMIGLTVGTVASVARAHGAGDRARVTHLLQQSMQLTVLLGLFVAGFGNLIAEPVMVALGAGEDSLGQGLAYLRPLLLGTAFYYLNILFAAVLRGVGNTRLAFAIAVLMNGLNFVLNYGLILGHWGLPALGIQGAAIGTVLAQATAALVMMGLLARETVPGARLVVKPARIDTRLARDLARIGWPASVDLVVFNAGFLTIIGLLGRIDEVAVAAHGLGLRVQALAFVPGMSISQATGAMVGNVLGAGKPDEARTVVQASVVLSTLVMTVLALIIIGYASELVTLFDVEPGTELHRYSVMWMELLGWGMPIVGTAISFSGMLQGAGETRTSLRINATITLVMQIPGSFLLGLGLSLGAFGVWLAFPLSFVFRVAWGYWEYRRGHWARVGARA